MVVVKGLRFVFVFLQQRPANFFSCRCLFISLGLIFVLARESVQAEKSWEMPLGRTSFISLFFVCLFRLC